MVNQNISEGDVLVDEGRRDALAVLRGKVSMTDVLGPLPLYSSFHGDHYLSLCSMF